MLTDDMTRLCGEIVALRTRRGELVDSLKRASRNRRESVADFCKQLSGARSAMTRQTKNDRVSALRSLRQSVHKQCREMQADLRGVRKAWAGRPA